MALVLSIWELILSYKHIKNAYNCKQYNKKKTLLNEIHRQTNMARSNIRSFFLKIQMYLVVLRI